MFSTGKNFLVKLILKIYLMGLSFFWLSLFCVQILTLTLLYSYLKLYLLIIGQRVIFIQLSMSRGLKSSQVLRRV